MCRAIYRHFHWCGLMWYSSGTESELVHVASAALHHRTPWQWEGTRAREHCMYVGVSLNNTDDHWSGNEISAMTGNDWQWAWWSHSFSGVAARCWHWHCTPCVIASADYRCVSMEPRPQWQLMAVVNIKSQQYSYCNSETTSMAILELAGPRRPNYESGN